MGMEENFSTMDGMTLVDLGECQGDRRRGILGCLFAEA